MERFLASTLLIFCFGSALSVDIATYAREHIGSTQWSYASHYVTDRYTAYSDTEKAHLYVYDVIEYCTQNAPKMYGMHGCGGGMHHRMMMMGCYGPIAASDWGNMQCHYMDTDCWMAYDNTFDRQLGDVISDGKSVAIVTGYNVSTSTNRYVVVENDWGFRPNGDGSYDSMTACWRYMC